MTVKIEGGVNNQRRLKHTRNLLATFPQPTKKQQKYGSRTRGEKIAISNLLL